MDDVLTTLDFFCDQGISAINDVDRLEISELKNVSHINISAMGASAFGYYIVKALFGDQIKRPLLLHSNYFLPEYVGKNSLFIPVSYSGTTEEVLNTTNAALARDVHVIGITKVNSPLGKTLTAYKKTFYNLIPRLNPANQPRMGTGYTIVGLMAILSKLRLINFDCDDAVKTLKKMAKLKNVIKDFAKNLSVKIKEKEILIATTDHLSGNAHVLRNQINETAKNFCEYSLIPELNHHLMEGFKHPENLTRNLAVLVINSNLFSLKNKKRMDLFAEIARENKLAVENIDVLGDDKLSQVFWMLSFGGYLSYYMACDYGEDPKAIPWVNYFKKKLSAHDSS